MNCTIATEYEFCSGHWLPNVPKGHKCRRPHGHNYRLVVGLVGKPNAHTGMLIDFFDLDKIVRPVVELVDHFVLNDVEGLENPTAENIALWFLNRLYPDLRQYGVIVRIYETPTCWAEIQVPANAR